MTTQDRNRIRYALAAFENTFEWLEEAGDHCRCEEYDRGPCLPCTRAEAKIAIAKLKAVLS